MPSREKVHNVDIPKDLKKEPIKQPPDIKDYKIKKRKKQ